MLYSILFLLTFTFGPAQQQFDVTPIEEARPTKETISIDGPFLEDTMPRPIPQKGYEFL